MKKGLIAILLLSISLLFGCGQDTKTNIPDAKTEPVALDAQEQIKVTVGAPKTAVTIPILRIMETNALGDKIKIDLKIFGDTEKMMAIAVSKDYGLLAVSVNTAVTLYNKGLDVRLLNASVWGGMYLSTTDSKCYEWEDLKGKQLYVISKGSVPDIITQHFLKQHGLKIGDNIEVVYSTYPEISQLIKLGKIKYAVDGEPFATANQENIDNYRVILDYVDDWKKTEGSECSLPAYGVVANNVFLSKNEELVKIFNQEYQKALEWALDNPREAGALAEKYLNVDGKLIEKAMPKFNFCFKTSVDAKKDIEQYCTVLASFKPESIGGKAPDEDFYYKTE